MGPPWTEMCIRCFGLQWSSHFLLRRDWQDRGTVVQKSKVEGPPCLTAPPTYTFKTKRPTLRFIGTGTILKKCLVSGAMTIDVKRALAKGMLGYGGKEDSCSHETPNGLKKVRAKKCLPGKIAHDLPRNRLEQAMNTIRAGTNWPWRLSNQKNLGTHFVEAEQWMTK